MKEVQVHFNGRAYTEMMRLQQDEETTPNTIIRKGLQIYSIAYGYWREGKLVAVADPNTHNTIEEIDISQSFDQGNYGQNVSIRVPDEVYSGLDRISSESSVPIDEIIRRGVVAYGSVQRSRKKGLSLVLLDYLSREPLNITLDIPEITAL